MTDTQPTQPEPQPPPGRPQPQWAAPKSTGSELFVSWLLIVTFILFRSSA
jgi:hypothetical protein